MMKKIDISTPKHLDTYAIVDDEDFEYLNQWKWTPTIHYGRKNTKIYNIVRRTKEKLKSIQVEIMGIKNGYVIDHINRNPLDNRKENLRWASKQENAMNQTKQIRKTASKYKGVSFHKPTKKWRAQIQYNKKQIHLGLFLNEKNAAIEYNKKAIEMFGSFANLNII